MHAGQQRRRAGAGGEQRVVADRPDLAGVHRDRVAGELAFGDAVEAEPVALEVQADHLLAPVGREIDGLEEPGVDDVQAFQALAGLVDGVAGAHQPARDRHPFFEQGQRVADAFAHAGRCGRGGGGGVVHARLRLMQCSVGKPRQRMNNRRRHCVTFGEPLVNAGYPQGIGRARVGPALIAIKVEREGRR